MRKTIEDIVRPPTDDTHEALLALTAIVTSLMMASSNKRVVLRGVDEALKEPKMHDNELLASLRALLKQLVDIEAATGKPVEYA